MSAAMTTSSCFDEPVADEFVSLPSEPTARAAELHRYFDHVVRMINDALYSNSWIANRTNFAAPEIVAVLPAAQVDEAVEAHAPSRALQTFERLRKELQLDDRSTAALVGISRNTPRGWRRGDQPKPATTRRLYELAAVLELVGTREHSLAQWARRPSPEGRSWIEIAGEPAGPSTILRHYRQTVLMPRPPTRLHVADDDELDAGDDPPPNRGRSSDAVERRQGRRRRPR